MHQLLSLKTKIWVIVGLAALISAVARTFHLDAVTLGVVVGIVDFVVIHLLMKSWPLLRLVSWLPLPRWTFIDLSGQWSGDIRSQWRASSADAPLPPIVATLELRQGWQKVIFGLTTEKMSSRSSPAIPSFDFATRELQFRYFYETTPTIGASGANPPQVLGSAIARVCLDRPNEMTIAYSNERGLGGDIILKRHVPSEVGRRKRRLSIARRTELLSMRATGVTKAFN